MSADIINLRRAKKVRARLDKTDSAARNRAAFGRTKGQKQLEDLDRERARRALNGAVRDGPAEPPDQVE